MIPLLWVGLGAGSLFLLSVLFEIRLRMRETSDATNAAARSLRTIADTLAASPALKAAPPIEDEDDEEEPVAPTAPIVPIVDRHRKIVADVLCPFPETKLKPGESTSITTAPQIAFTAKTLWFAAERLDDLMVDEIRIGNRSQFAVAGGGCGGPTAPAALLHGRSIAIEECQVNVQFRLWVRNVGETEMTVRAFAVGDAAY